MSGRSVRMVVRAIGICSAFAVVFLPVAAIESAEDTGVAPKADGAKSVIHVSASNTSGPWDGTTVETAFLTIQEGINAAVNFDQVVVEEGVYVENIHLDGKNISVMSTDPSSNSVVAATTINGNSVGSVVTFAGTESGACTLAGFTIVSGQAANGGGIYGGATVGTNATIRENVIKDNTAAGVSGVSPGSGGGLLNCDGYIFGNVIGNNLASNAAVGKATLPGLGGGLALCDGTIQGNRIIGNTAGHGGGLLNCDAMIEGNFIEFNFAGYDGGGMSGCDLPIRNNVIWANTAGNGGGIAWANGAIENNSIVGNSATYGGGLYGCDTTALIRNCIIWGNTGMQLYLSNMPTYSCIEMPTKQGDTNLYANPQFVSIATGDFHLLPTSPCIDAGVRILAVSEDFEGQARPFDGTAELRGDGSDYDIGADEYVPTGTFYVLTAGVSPSGAGSVRPNPEGPAYAALSNVVLTATANSGWAFDHWEGDLSGSDNPGTVTMDADKNVTAVFVLRPQNVRGRVVNRRTGANLPGVTVNLLDAATGSPLASPVTTSADGMYLISSPDGVTPLRLVFEATGYDSATRAGFRAPAIVNAALLPSGPLPPTGLRGRAGVGHVWLRWRPSPDFDVVGYNVYRRRQGDPLFTLLNQVHPAVFPVYRDATAVSGQVYTYFVRAVDRDANLSGPSNAVTITAGLLVMEIPDVWNEPGEKVRIPLSVWNARGIGPYGLDINFRYPADLAHLTVDSQGHVLSGVGVERTAITASLEFEASITEAGRVHIRGADPEGLGALRGEGHLFDIVLTLRNDAPLECQQMLFEDYVESSVGHDGVTFYDSTPAKLPTDYSDTGDLCVAAPGKAGETCKQGDLNYDGDVDAEDVQVALLIAAGVLTPDETCQVFAGDFNGDGEIDSADALMLQRMIAELPVNPSEGSETLGAILDPNDPVTMSAAQSAAYPGEIVEVPVSISDAEGLCGLDVTLAYPPELSVESVANGALTANFEREQDAGAETSSPGQLRVSMSSEEALPGGSDSVLIVTFRVAGQVQGETELPVTVGDVALKGKFGDSFDWYTNVTKQDGSVSVESKDMPQDINNDAAVDAVDVQLVINMVLGLGEQPHNCDVNQDGSVDALDVQLVINAALGL